MAAQNSVADIGVRLTVDTSQFEAGVKRAAGSLGALRGTTQAGRGGGSTDRPAPRTAGTATTAAGPQDVKGEVSFTKAQVRGALRAATEGLNINVPISITSASIAAAKTKIMEGIGTVPVTIAPRFAGSGPQSITNVMGGVLSMQYGISQTQGRALFKETVQKLGPMPKGMATGGNVSAFQPTVVGERRPEVFVPQVNGRILPSVSAYRNEVGNLDGLISQIGQRQRTIQSMLSGIPQAAAGSRVKGSADLARYGPQSAMEQNIMSVVNRMSPNDIHVGRNWYDWANQITKKAAAHTGYSDTSRALASVAATSPQMLFASNIAHATSLMQGAGTGRYPAKADADALLAQVAKWISETMGSGSMKIPSGVMGLPRMHAKGGPGGGEKAWQILTSQKPILDLLQGPKVVPFYENLSGDPTALTLDALASQVATAGAHKDSPKTGVFRDAMADAYREVHRSLPRSLKRQLPGIAQLQAATWVNWRGAGMASGGPVGMMKGAGFVPGLRDLANEYNRSVGLPEMQSVLHPLSEDFSRRTALAYEALPSGSTALSRKAYAAFAEETAAQHRFLRDKGFSFIPSASDPYDPAGGLSKMQVAAQDVIQNKRLLAYASELSHPLMTDEQNLAFRHVHDMMGHLSEGFSIGPKGEYNAAVKHSQMFSPLARMAMLAETHGQNSVVNYSPTVLPGRSASIAAINRESPGSIYAEQKSRLLPQEILSEFYQRTGISGRQAGGAVSMKEPPEGYDFRATVDDPLGRPQVMVKAYDPTGLRVGFSTFVGNRHGNLYPEWAGVDDAHQGRGVASAMYALAERETGRVLSPARSQTALAKRMWADPRRPFGGDPDAVPGQMGAFWPARRWSGRSLGGAVDLARDWRTQDWRRGFKPEQVPTENLMRFMFVDREVTPKPGGGRWYLDELTEKIGAEGFDENFPLKFYYDPDVHKGVLGDGNHRFSAAARLGLPSLPVDVRSMRGSASRKYSSLLGPKTTFPDESGYVPANLPASWIGLMRPEESPYEIERFLKRRQSYLREHRMMGGHVKHMAMGGLLGRMAAPSPLPTSTMRHAGQTGDAFARLAEAKFGFTDRPEKAGWIGPGGDYLDFSAGTSGRYFDHWEAASLFPGMEQGPDVYEAMMERGWMRLAAFNPAWFGAEMSQPATESQIRRIVADAKFMNVPEGTLDWRDYMGGSKTMRADGRRIGMMLREMNQHILGRPRGMAAGGHGVKFDLGGRGGMKPRLARRTRDMVEDLLAQFPLIGTPVTNPRPQPGVPGFPTLGLVDIDWDEDALASYQQPDYENSRFQPGHIRMAGWAHGAQMKPLTYTFGGTTQRLVPPESKADTLYGRKGEIRPEYIRSQKQGGTWWAPYEKNVEAMVTHEFGHAVDLFMRRTFSEAGPTTIGKTYGRLRDDLRDPEMRIADGDMRRSRSRTIGKYAASDSTFGNEGFAELFANTVLGGPDWGINPQSSSDMQAIVKQLSGLRSIDDLSDYVNASRLRSPSGLYTMRGSLNVDELRQNIGIKHAGVGARALRATLASNPMGGTFPASPGISVPRRGHAVGIPQLLGGAGIDVPMDPNNLTTESVRAFLDAFHTQRKMGAPFVGTWLDPDTGMITVDPSTVIPRKKDADLVLRAAGEKAAFDLKRFEEWYASNRGVRAAPERILQALYSGTMKNRAAGGDTAKGLYIVGEIGEELFVPKSMEDMIPKEVMDNIPKAAGGAQVIGKKRNQLWAAPDDGWIIPNRLLPKVDHIPRMQEGGPTRRRFPGSFTEGPIGWVDRAGNVHSLGGDESRLGGIMGRESSYDPRLLVQGRPSPLNVVEDAHPEVGLTGRGITTGGFGPADAAPLREAASRGFMETFGRVFSPSLGPRYDPFIGRGGPFAGTGVVPGGYSDEATDLWRPGGVGQRIGARGPSGPLSQRINEVRLQSEAVTIEQPRSVAVGEKAAEYGTPGRAGTAMGQHVYAGQSPSAGQGLMETRQDFYRAAESALVQAGQATTTRTPRGQIAVLSSTFLGGGRQEQLQNLAEQRAALRDLRQTEAKLPVGSRFDEYLEALDDLNLATKENHATALERVESLERENPQLRAWADANDRYQKTVAKGLPGLKEGIVGLGKVLVGIQAYSLAIKGVGFLMSAAAPAAATFVDQLRGWRSIADSTTTALAKGVRQAGGNTEAVIAQQAAQAGLSGQTLDYIQSTLGLAAAVKAGAQASKDAENLYKAAAGVPDVPAGLYGGYGGLFESGLFAELLGGGPGFTQTIAGRAAVNAGGGGFELGLDDLAAEGAKALEGMFGDVGDALNYLTSDRERAIQDYEAALKAQPPVPQQYANTGVDVGQQFLGGAADVVGFPATLGTVGIGAILDFFGAKNEADWVGSLRPGAIVDSAGRGVEAGVAAALPPAESPADAAARRVRETRQANIDAIASQREPQSNLLADLNAGLDRGSLRVDGVEGRYGFASSLDELNQAIRIAESVGDETGATFSRNSGIILRVGTAQQKRWDEFTKKWVMTTGDVANAAEYQALTIQSAVGAAIPAMEAWVAESMQSTAAQIAGSEMAGARERSLIGGQLGFQMLGNPLIRPGAQAFANSSPGAISAVGGTSTGFIGGALRDAQKYQSELTVIAEQGYQDQIAALETAWPEGNPLIKEFKTLYSQAQQTSGEIQSTTEEMMGLQQQASQAQWANSIRIAQRSLGDALGMLGQAGGTRLGYLQREDWLAQRASQSLGLASQRLGLVAQNLSLALQRRQIATQLALAQFQAPGETGEERYARQREAIVRAGIQRRQLGISERQHGISQQQVDIAGRQFVIAGRVWSENAHRAAIDARRSIQVQRISQNAQVAAIAAQSKISAAQQVVGQRVAQMNNILGRANNIWSTATNAAISGVGKFTGSVSAAADEILSSVNLYAQKDKKGNYTIRGAGLANLGPQAAGMIGDVRQASELTVGEAGAETVAILRNPRRGSVSGGGIGGSMVNHISISITGSGDPEATAEAVARKVENILSRKGQLLGLRTPSY